MAENVERVRVGIAPAGKKPVRQHAVLKNSGSEISGEVSSGGFGPSLGRPVAMGYIKPEDAEIGTDLVAEVRGKEVACKVVDLPFVNHNYKRGS